MPACAPQSVLQERADHVHKRAVFLGFLRSTSPLLLVLALQSVLSLGLMRSDTAFTDEALYLWAGHLEIAHLLHGIRIPAFPSYFSGSPVIYPPLGAVADHIGGLAGARVLSLCFMLGATSFLWATARRLYGRRTGFFAAALWVALGPTLHLSAFATYDALAMLFVALSAWCAVRAGSNVRIGGWIMAAALALALANATKYASAIFDPAVAALVAWSPSPHQDRRRCAARTGTFAAYLAGILVVMAAEGGAEYFTGIGQTTLTRKVGTNPILDVLAESWQWLGLLFILAVTAIVIVLMTERATRPRLLMMTLAATCLLVPAEQARLHTTTSLDKHDDFGAWFAAIAAAFAIDWLIRRVRPGVLRLVAEGACCAGLAFPCAVAVVQAGALFNWPNSTTLVRVLRQLAAATPGPILAEHPSLLEYYLPEGAQWYRWSSTRSIRLASGTTSAPVNGQLSPRYYIRAIRKKNFSLIVIDFTTSTRPVDRAIVHLLRHDPDYRHVASVPYGSLGATVWKLRAHEGPAHTAAPPPPGNADSSIIGNLLKPQARPNPFLGWVARVTYAMGLITILYTVAVRLIWRRGKGREEP